MAVLSMICTPLILKEAAGLGSTTITFFPLVSDVFNIPSVMPTELEVPMKMRVLASTFILHIFFIKGFSQDLVKAESVLTNFAKRVYGIEKFVGVKLVEIDEDKYIIISVKLEKKNNTPSALSTIANMKAKAFYSQFQNGSYITTEFVMVNSNNDSSNTHPLTSEVMKEYSSGFTKGLGSLAVLEDVEIGYNVYFYYAKLAK